MFSFLLDLTDALDENVDFKESFPEGFVEVIGDFLLNFSKDFGDFHTISHNDIDINRITAILLAAINALVIIASLEKLGDVLPDRAAVGKTNDAMIKD